MGALGQFQGAQRVPAAPRVGGDHGPPAAWWLIPTLRPLPRVTLCPPTPHRHPHPTSGIHGPEVTRSPPAPWPQPPEVTPCHRVLAAAPGYCPTRDARMAQLSAQPGRWIQPSHLQVTPKPPSRSRGVRDLGPPRWPCYRRHGTKRAATTRLAGHAWPSAREVIWRCQWCLPGWRHRPWPFAVAALSPAALGGSPVPCPSPRCRGAWGSAWGRVGSWHPSAAGARLGARLCQRGSCQPGAESCHLWVAENDYPLLEWSRREAGNCISPHSLRWGMEQSDTSSPRQAGTPAELSPRSHVPRGSWTLLHPLSNPSGVGCILPGRRAALWEHLPALESGTGPWVPQGSIGAVGNPQQR